MIYEAQKLEYMRLNYTIWEHKLTIIFHRINRMNRSKKLFPFSKLYLYVMNLQKK